MTNEERAEYQAGQIIETFRVIRDGQFSRGVRWAIQGIDRAALMAQAETWGLSLSWVML